MVVAVANSESADEDAPLSLAQHRVPHRGGVVAALDRCHGRARRLGVGRETSLDQLSTRRDLTRVGVDEEDGHRGLSLASSSRATAAGAARSRCSSRTCAAAERRRRRATPTPSTRGQFARWAAAQRLAPDAVTPRAAAPLCGTASPRPGRRRAPSRASSRRCARCSARSSSTARSSRTPPTCCPRRAAAQRLPRVLKAAEVAALLDRIPADTAARAARPRAVRAGIRVRPARRGARQPRPSARSTSTANACGSRARAARPASCRPASRRCGRSSRYCERGRPALATADATQALFMSKSGRRLSTSDVRRRLRVWARQAAGVAGASRTRCGTPSPRTCWTAEPTCARSRSCSGTPRSVRPRSTLG